MLLTAVFIVIMWLLVRVRVVAYRSLSRLTLRRRVRFLP